MRVSFLGPKNSFSYLAVCSLYENNSSFSFLPQSSFFDALESVADGKSDRAVVPQENLIEGNVNEVSDFLLFSEKPIYIVKEFNMPITNFLITKKGVTLSEIKTLYSHNQPLMQCRGNIKKLIPSADIILSSSSSNAVNKITNSTIAAIGGRQLIGGNLQAYSNTPIDDSVNNCTRFLVFSKTENRSEKNTKFTIAFEAQDKPGGLLLYLEILKEAGLNITRIESRPHKSVLGRYVFLLDILGNNKNIKTQKALSQIEKTAQLYKFFGGYSETKLTNNE